MTKPAFSKAFLDKQREKLLTLREELLNSLNTTVKEEINHAAAEPISEDGDLAQALINQQVTLSMHEKTITKLRGIDEALEKLDNGTYGFCEESGEPIEKKRLEIQPWAKLSIAAAEEIEREQRRYLKAI